MAKPTKASREAFSSDIAALKNEDISELVLELGISAWDEVRLWLEFHVEHFLARQLTHHWFYRKMLRIAPKHGVPDFQPTGFVHPRIPVESQARLARTYRTSETLREATWNPVTPRGDVLAARILGLLSDEECERVPVKFHRSHFRMAHRRRKTRGRP